MKKKYKALNELENIIVPYILRTIKEIPENEISKIKKFYIAIDIQKIIQTVLYDKDNREKIIVDVINMICDVGNISINDLIEDVNKSKCINIKTLNDLISFIKLQISSVHLVTQPLYYMMCWTYTKRGDKFYRDLNDKLKLELRISKLLLYYNIQY